MYDESMNVNMKIFSKLSNYRNTRKIVLKQNL